jgi:hypothetical protein
MEIAELQAPIEAALADEMIGFWERIFGLSFAGLRGVLAGEESQQNRDLFFLVRQCDRLAGTCHLTIGRSSPDVGGLGEVATDPEFRRQGLANALCTRARNVFGDCGGRGLFLGTTAPQAARVYGRLGWHTLAGTNVMLLTSRPQSPQEFLADHFRSATPVSVAPATAADRTAIIPLLVWPHDWHVLDANVRIFSSRYVTKNSCMGLYPRYEAIRADRRGNWFVARDGQGHVVGLSTVRLDDEQGRARVDGFAHGRHAGCVASLIDESMRWGAAHGASAFEAVIPIDDATKRAQFEGIGFRVVAAADPFEADGQRFSAVRLEMPVAV